MPLDAINSFSVPPSCFATIGRLEERRACYFLNWLLSQLGADPEPFKGQSILDLLTRYASLHPLGEAENLEDKVKRLEAELQRRRDSETHLIRERDRLIHEDLESLHQQLNASQERVKYLTELLQNVAAMIAEE